MSLKSTREFLLQEKLFSIRDKVKVRGIDKQELGIFASKIISIGKNYRLYTIEDQENAILTVKEKVISLRSTYSFFKGDKDDANLIGKLKQKLISIKPKYWFEDPDENKMFTMKGNIWQLKYKIYLEDKVVAEISKKLWKIKDTYGVRMDESLDDDSAMLVLGIVVMLHHEKEEQESRRRRH
ncbi:MAG: LURP-one-related family protein [Candidatus Lokiarchaeota archaeon]|nr:LURP-one-related family protein [Candidatus Lokiarchaeota archaeon]